MSLRDQTVAEYYRTYGYEHRAVLAGPRESPALWLTKVPGPKGVLYALCFGARDGIVFCDPERRVATLAGYQASVQWDYTGRGRPRKQRAA